jgi:GNAT superfamily N-acetyltransferase
MVSPSATIRYRPATGTADFAPTYELFLAAANDLRSRSQRELVDDSEARRTRAMAFRRHTFDHDPAGFWIAEADGQRIGFGIATARPGFWHLNALHVLPAYQAQGVGGALLRCCLAYGRGPGVVSTVISETAQPISNALYARHGMYQWLPLLHVSCRIFRPELPAGSQVTIAGGDDSRTLAALDRIDQVVLGFTRPVDHRFWIGLPDLTLLLLDAGAEKTGYAYLSRFGGIGPCAVLQAEDLSLLLPHAVALAEDLGVPEVSFVVPGVATSAVDYLLAQRARYDASMTLLLSSRPFGQLERYLLSASDALF